jgi:hypothetical protein
MVDLVVEALRTTAGPATAGPATSRRATTAGRTTLVVAGVVLGFPWSGY